MKKIKIQIVLALSATLFLISSCAKDGDTGPAGQAGTNGNANVKSFTFTAVPGEWSNYGTPGQTGHCKFVEKFFPQITQNVFDNGTVLGYIKESDYWNALPFTVFATTGTIYFHPIYRLQHFEIDCYLSNLATPNITTSFDFKIVIVDGSLRAMNPDLDWNNYDQVADRFNLK